jgi:hypothetical protein
MWGLKMAMASNLQASRQAPQRLHLDKSMTAFLFTMVMAENGQTFTQSPQPTHFSIMTLIESLILILA